MAATIPNQVNHAEAQMNNHVVNEGKSTLSFDIDNHKLTVIEMNGDIYFIAKEIGEILGYGEDGAALGTLLTRNWSEEMLEGRHWVRLERERLAAVKNYLTENQVVAPQTKHLLLLTEPGLWRVLILTGKPAGIRLRDRLDSEILPQLRKTGSYTLPTVAPAAPPELAQLNNAQRTALTQLLPKLAKLSPDVITNLLTLAHRHQNHLDARVTLMERFPALSDVEITSLADFIEQACGGTSQLPRALRATLALKVASALLAQPDAVMLQNASHILAQMPAAA